MKKFYKLNNFGNFRRVVLAASITGAVLMTGGARAQYCSSAAFNAGDDDIFNVTFGQLNNTSNCSAGQGGPNTITQCYTDFSQTVPTFSYAQTFTYPLSITVDQCNGGTYSGYVGVWIDFDQDGTFNGMNEQVYMSNNNIWPPGGLTTGPVGGITIPPGATPGLTRMRIVASEYNQPSPCGGYSYGETEDYSVYILQVFPCNNTPVANSVASSGTYICPSASVALGTTNQYLFTGINYQWFSSTQSNLGPWQPIVSANTAYYNATGITNTTWYTLVAACANGGSPAGTTLTPIGVTVAPTTINSVPYLENFDNAATSAINKLPNCSWKRTNSINCKTTITASFGNRQPFSGAGFANFDYGNSYGTSIYNFYSNGIQLNAGVTYSAWVYYITPGFNAYNNFTLKYGPNQSQNGMVTLNTVPSPNNSSYKLLSSTFQVTVSGVYYLNVSAQDNYGGSFLSFDDLGIMAPCSYTNNAANLTANGPSAICAGNPAVFSAAGAASYSWSTGSATQNLTVTPLNNTIYSVVGTNTLSNCTATISFPLIVNPLPGVQIFAPKTTVCEGESVLLFASGSANSFTWSTNGITSPQINLVPVSSTLYSVLGINSYGCTNTASQMITVNTAPGIVVTGNTNICQGEPGTLTANGADTYKWSASNAFLQTNPITPYPQASTSYTVTGKDSNGCEGTTIVYMVVNACTGIANVSGNIEGLQVYPNPNSGEFTVELKNGLNKTIEVIDLTGRIIALNSSNDNLVKVNINSLSDGVYYVKVKSDNAVEVLKVVKQ